MTEKSYRYCCQCPEQETSEVGCFIFDNARPFFAISPIFPGLIELYAWMQDNHWRSIPGGVWTCERT